MASSQSSCERALAQAPIAWAIAVASSCWPVGDGWMLHVPLGSLISSPAAHGSPPDAADSPNHDHTLDHDPGNRQHKQPQRHLPLDPPTTERARRPQAPRLRLPPSPYRPPGWRLPGFSALRFAPQQPGEVDVEPPAVCLGREQPPVAGVPPARLRTSQRRAPPVIRDTKERSGLAHAISLRPLLAPSIEIPYGYTLGSRPCQPRLPVAAAGGAPADELARRWPLLLPPVARPNPGTAAVSPQGRGGLAPRGHQ
jgi:hypothetical protein